MKDDTLTIPATIALYPTAEAFSALLAGPADQPVVMVNLLRFKAISDLENERLSGEASYQRYVDEMIPFVKSKGGRVIWSGRLDSQVIGTGAECFDMVALVEYPSRQVFVEIATDPYVQEIGVFRAAGLAGQWLLAASEQAATSGSAS